LNASSPITLGWTTVAGQLVSAKGIASLAATLLPEATSASGLYPSGACAREIGDPVEFPISTAPSRPPACPQPLAVTVEKVRRCAHLHHSDAAATDRQCFSLAESLSKLPTIGIKFEVAGDVPGFVISCVSDHNPTASRAKSG